MAKKIAPSTKWSIKSTSPIKAKTIPINKIIDLSADFLYSTKARARLNAPHRTNSALVSVFIKYFEHIPLMKIASQTRIKIKNAKLVNNVSFLYFISLLLRFIIQTEKDMGKLFLRKKIKIGG